jgi:hypothetical protein
VRPPVEDLVRQGLGAVALATPELVVSSKKNGVGIFPINQSGRAAQAFVSENGLLESSRTEAGDFQNVTSKGWHWLRGQGAPVLNDFLRQMEQWKDQDRALIAKVRENSARLDRLAEVLKSFLGHTEGEAKSSNSSATCLKTKIVHFLSERQHSASRVQGASCDTSLPELFGHLVAEIGQVLTVGEFHDALRDLHQKGEVLLHPWTGTLYSIPEPGVAFLVGHEVAYYVSLKTRG